MTKQVKRKNRFQINSGTMIISDPCYSLGTWCQASVRVKKGEWKMKVLKSKGHIRMVSIQHVDFTPEVDNTSLKVRIPATLGVDSGQIGFFDAEGYLNSEAVKDCKKYDFPSRPEDDDDFYRACCYLTLTQDYGTLPFGAVTQTGYGDGSYSAIGFVADNEADQYQKIIVWFF